MPLNLHPDAAANFVEKASALLKLISTSEVPRRKASFDAEIFTTQTLTPELMLGHVRSSEADFKGDEVSRFIVNDGRQVGLTGEAYLAFDSLSHAIQKSAALKDTISLRSVKDTIFDWLISKHRQEEVPEFLEFVLPILESRIRPHQVWVPIFRTYIESSFNVGPVVFQPISKVVMDTWQAALVNDIPEHKKADFLKSFEKDRADLQGLMAGTMDFVADPDRAAEIALVQVEKALNFVKFFEPANFHPSLLSHCTVLGKQHVQSTTLLRITDNRLTHLQTELISKSGIHWLIDNDLIAHMKRDGLEKLGAMLASADPSEFQGLLINAIQLYSRVGLAKTIADKLVYLFATLETLLLKDTSEMIQHNVGERLAFALEVHPDARIQVLNNFKEVYRMRSEFVHHGADVSADQTASIVRLMGNTWRFLHKAIRNSDNLQTKEQLIQAIDRIKFT